MGTWSLYKANFGSIFIQRKLQAALADGDEETVTDLISQSIVTILKAGLTPRQRRNLDELKQTHRDEMKGLIDDAFQRGWLRDGTPNLSNAMDEVLITVAERIREARANGECGSEFE
jgi:hypothetical protein